MNRALRILADLRLRGIKFRLIKHEKILTIEDVEKVLNVKRSQMVKTIVLVRKDTGRIIIACVPASKKLNWKLLAKELKAKRGQLELLDHNLIEEKTGFQLGGVPPFGYTQSCQIVFDRELQRERLIYCSAGVSTLSLEINPRILLRINRAKLVSI